MSFNAEVIKLLGAALQLLQAQERKNDEPAYEPEPFKPEKPKKNESWLEAHQRRIRDDCRRGRAISMNALGRTVMRPKPPRRPGQQSRHWNGLWWYR